jgi:hypothetical protein
MRPKAHILLMSILLVLILASCNLGKSPEPTADVNAVYTSVAGTMIAQLNDQLTQTAQAVPSESLASPTESPTLPPLPTLPIGTDITPFSPTAAFGVVTSAAGPPPAAGTGSGSTAVGCADSIFVADITIPDGTVEKPGATFKKVWRMQNSGTCNWGDGFVFAFVYGSNMGGGSIKITDQSHFVAPGGTGDFGVNMTAPAIPNTYGGCWRMQTNSGFFFGQLACVKIKVSK